MHNSVIKPELRRTLHKLQKQLQKYSRYSDKIQSQQSDSTIQERNDAQSSGDVPVLHTHHLNLLITHLELIITTVLQIDDRFHSANVPTAASNEIHHNEVQQDSTILVNHPTIDEINAFQHNHIQPIIHALQNDEWWRSVENNIYEDAYWKGDTQTYSDVIDDVYYPHFDSIHNESTLLFEFDSFELDDEGIIEDAEPDLEQLFDEEMEYEQDLSETFDKWEDENDDTVEEYEDYSILDEDIDADDHQPGYREYYYRLYNDTSDYDEKDDYDDM